MKSLIFLPLTLLLPVAASAGKLSDGLVVYLSFDDTTQNTAAGPYATKVIGSEFTPRFTEGRFGKAAEFRGDAKEGRVTADWALSLPPELEKIYAGDWSVSLWVKDADPADCVIIGNKDWTTGANTGWAISSMPNNYRDASKPVTQLGKINWTVRGGSRHDYTFTPKNSFVREGWHHLALTCSRADDIMTVYLDGEAINTTSSDYGRKLGTLDKAHDPLSAGLETVIGAGARGTFGAKVVVDDVALWSRALEPREVKVLTGRAAKIPEPSAYAFLGAGLLGGIALIRRRRK